MKNEELYAPLGNKYQELKSALEGTDLKRMIELTLELHGMVHPGIVSGRKEKTIADYVLDYMLQDNNKEALVPRMNCEINLDWAGADVVPMCWQFWHTYRIEDLVSNILIADQEQIFNKDWQKRMNSPITDTGNALEDEEAVAFGKMINEKVLYEYIIEVSKNTRKIISTLTLEKIKQKATAEQLDRVVKEGGLIQDKRSIWLKDYWGGLTVAEMILTPFTDHHMMHLPPCLEYLPILQP